VITFRCANIKVNIKAAREIFINLRVDDSEIERLARAMVAVNKLCRSALREYFASKTSIKISAGKRKSFESKYSTSHSKRAARKTIHDDFYSNFSLLYCRRKATERKDGKVDEKLKHRSQIIRSHNFSSFPQHLYPS